VGAQSVPDEAPVVLLRGRVHPPDGPRREVLYVGTSKNLKAAGADVLHAAETRSTHRRDGAVLATGVETTGLQTQLEGAGPWSLRLIDRPHPRYNRRSKFPREGLVDQAHHRGVPPLLPRVARTRRRRPLPGSVPPARRAPRRRCWRCYDACAMRRCTVRLSVRTARSACAVAELRALLRFPASWGRRRGVQRRGRRRARHLRRGCTKRSAGGRGGAGSPRRTSRRSVSRRRRRCTGGSESFQSGSRRVNTRPSPRRLYPGGRRRPPRRRVGDPRRCATDGWRQQRSRATGTTPERWRRPAAASAQSVSRPSLPSPPPPSRRPNGSPTGSSPTGVRTSSRSTGSGPWPLHLGQRLTRLVLPPRQREPAMSP